MGYLQPSDNLVNDKYSFQLFLKTKTNKLVSLYSISLYRKDDLAVFECVNNIYNKINEFKNIILDVLFVYGDKYAEQCNL